MPTTNCPICDETVTYSVSPSYPATRYEPAGGGDIEDIEPRCDCATLRCVDEVKYYDWIAERIRDGGVEVEDDGDAAFEAWRESRR